MSENFDLEELVHLEQTFYDVGYADGFAHGRIHGLIEGRALGREKGFEIWEEIGFYEGFALTWRAICTQYNQKNDQRAMHHIVHLLDLVRQFPTANPSPARERAAAEDDDEPDLSRLQSQIRSRYKALCASLGVRPSLRASAVSAGDDGVKRGGSADRTQIHRPQDASAKRDVWTLEGDVRHRIVQGSSF